MDDRKISLWFAGTAAVLFFLLVAFGITGSSLGWLKNYPGMQDIMKLVGERKLLGTYRGIRSDEILHHGTPAALAQYQAVPQFPRYNRNEGLTGRDLTVLHDTGAPVRHFVMLARPSVWGFFIMDLRRALAWYWWFPVFFGFFGLWLLLNQLFSGQRFLHGLLSLSLTLSPICAAWSFWPLINAGGLCLAAALFLQLFQTHKSWQRWLLALLMAWTASCSLMTLYFPRLYPLLWLLAFVVIAYITENHLWTQLKTQQILIPFIAAVLLCCGFILLWMYDAYPAIHSLAQTDYPGQRRMNGGTMGIWTIVKGWLAPLTVYKIEYSNQCELQGPFSLWFPLLIVLWYYFKRNRKDFLGWSLAVIVLWTCLYQICGFPEWFCSLTFWNRCNPARCDFVQAFAQIIFIAMLARRMPKQPVCRPWLYSWLTLVPVLLLLAAAPQEFYAGLFMVYPVCYVIIMIIVCLLSGWLCGWLFLKHSKAFIWVFCCVSILPGIVFNPVCIAPERIENKLSKLIQKETALKHDGCFLFLHEKNFHAVGAWLAGVKVFNGFYLYPDSTVIRYLFREHPNHFSYNCMANYDVIPCKHEKPLKTFEDTGCIHIKILVSGSHFDFSEWPVDFAAALQEYRALLTKNPSLQLIASGEKFDFYRVLNIVKKTGFSNEIKQKRQRPSEK